MIPNKNYWIQEKTTLQNHFLRQFRYQPEFLLHNHFLLPVQFLNFSLHLPLFLLLDDDKKIDYDSLENVLYANFDIANLPKYEKHINPLLTPSVGIVVWTITHTCKTATPVIQLYKGDGILQNTETLPDLIITHKTSTTIEIRWTDPKNIAANKFY